MKVSGSHELSSPADRVYGLLHDPVVLARCIPGCEGLDRVAGEDYNMRMKLGIGSLSGRFDGKVLLAECKPPESFRMIVEGSGKIGFMKGDGLIALASLNGGGASVHFDGEVHVGGAIAGVGQRLIETTAKMIIRRFFEKLDSEAGDKAPASSQPASPL